MKCKKCKIKIPENNEICPSCFNAVEQKKIKVKNTSKEQHNFNGYDPTYGFGYSSEDIENKVDELINDIERNKVTEKNIEADVDVIIDCIEKKNKR